MQETRKDAGSIPGSRRSSGEGNGNPLPYSCLATSWTEQLSRLQSRGHKESERTEHARARTHTHTQSPLVCHEIRKTSHDPGSIMYHFYSWISQDQQNDTLQYTRYKRENGEIEMRPWAWHCLVCSPKVTMSLKYLTSLQPSFSVEGIIPAS